MYMAWNKVRKKTTGVQISESNQDMAFYLLRLLFVIFRRNYGKLIPINLPEA